LGGNAPKRDCHHTLKPATVAVSCAAVAKGSRAPAAKNNTGSPLFLKSDNLDQIGLFPQSRKR